MATLGEYLGAGASTTKLLLHFEGNCNDSSGNANNATGTGMSYGLKYGKFNQGICNTGYGNITLATLPFTSRPGTISFWMKSGDTSTNFQSLLFWGKSSSHNLSIQLGLDGEVRVQNGSTLLIGSPLAYDDNKWHNIILTVSSSADFILYVDSNNVGTTNSAYDFSGTYKYLLYNPSNKYFYGSFDEFIGENVAWSGEKVKKYYTMTKGRFGIT